MFTVSYLIFFRKANIWTRFVNEAKKRYCTFHRKQLSSYTILGCEISDSFNICVNCLILAQRIIPDAEYIILNE